MPSLWIPPDITIAHAAPITNMVLRYDGLGARLAVPALLPVGPVEAFSLEAWLYADRLDVVQAIWDNTLAGSEAFSVLLENGQLLVDYNSSGRFVFPYSFNVREWYYVAVVYDAAEKDVALYVNAVPQATGVVLDAQPVALGPAWIGGSARNQWFFKGTLAGIRLWQGTLDQASVERFMYLALNATVVVRQDGLVVAALRGNWPCDEGYGTLAFDRTGGANAALDGPTAELVPQWVVSTVLKPPDFIDFHGNPLLTHDEAPLSFTKHPAPPAPAPVHIPAPPARRTVRAASKRKKGGHKR